MGLLFGPPDTADLEPIFDVSDATPTLRHCGLPLPPLLSSWSEPSLPSLVATPALVAALESIVAALHVGERVLLFGPPAAGKTALLRAVAALAGRPLFTVQCTEDLTYQDFYGGYAPVPGASGQQQFVWQAGDLVRALQDGALVALEDVHRLAPEALHALGPLLDAGPASRVHPVGCPYPIHLSSPLLVATCTADEDRLPRLPDALWHRFAGLRVPEPAERDVHLIATQHMETLGLSTTAAQQLCDVHLGLPAALPAAAAAHGTVRSLLAAARLCRTVAAGEPGRPPPTSPAAVAAGIVYADSQPSLPLQDAARAYIASVCKATVGEVAGAVQITAAPAVTATQPFCQTAYSQRVLRRLALAVRSGAALVLEGPTCSGKTQLVQQLALQEGHPLVVIAAHASTEMTDLLGGPAPTVRFAGLAYDHDLHLVRRLIALLRPHVPSLKPLGEALLTITQPADEVAHILKHIRKGQFPAHVKTEAARLAKGRAGETTTGSMLRHRDGPLITAMRQGDWLLVDNLNLVSPGVLGLLLPLLEGARDTFHHPTCGDVAVHPDFRLLATCNSARGHPLPPAFLDRVLRVCLPPLDVAYLPAAAAAAAAPAAADDGGAHAAELRRHAQAIVAAHVGPLADHLLAVHQDVLKQRLQVPEGYAYTFRNLLHTVRAIKSCLSPLAAVRACYTDASRGVTDRPTIDAILRRNQLASDVEAIRELWRSQGTVLEVLSASHLLAGTLKADLQVQPSKRLLQVCKAPLFRQAEVQEYERQEMGKTLIHLEAAIRRRGVPSDAAMFEVLYVYFGALLRSIRAAGFAIPPELEVVLLAPTSPRTFKPAVRGPAKTVPSAVLSSVAAAAIAAAHLAHRPNRSPAAKPPAPTPETEPQPLEADEEDVPMAPPPNAKPAKAAASKKAAAPRSRWHQLRTNLRVFRRLTRREALLKAREVRQAGPGDSYGTLCAQTLFQSAVAQLSNAVYAALYNRAAAALPLMAGPPADLPPAVCVVVDNTPAPESVANQLVAALALVTHVLDALEVPCAVRRLYATQGSPFLEVKSTDKLMAEVNGQTLLDLCRPPLAGSELGPLSRPVALPARGVVALGQANEASLQRCEAAAGDLPCLKLLLPLDVVLFKPRDPLTVVLRDPVPADPDAPVSASQLFTLQAELTEALADFLFQAGVPDVGQTSVGLTFGTVSLPNALQEIGTLCTAAQELGHAAPARPPQTAGSGRAAPAPDAGPGAALLAALRPQLARDALRDAAAAVCPPPPTSMLERVEGLWANLEDVAAPLTAHLLEGLRHAAWPALEFTRSSPSLRGSRLSIRGLLRYFTSDGQYLKIWEQKDQGAIVRNAVCLVLDVSASMVPHFPAMLRGVVSCLAALAKAGVQHVGVVAFGDGLYVVKAPDEPWDSAAKHRLLATLAQARQRPPAGSPDAPALAVAVALLTQCPVIRPNDPKQVLVFTDGKGTSSPAFMRAVLASAHQSQVACTAVGLGDPAACCSVRYPAWVWGSDAAAVGPALQRWYSPGAAAPLPAAPYPPAAIAVPCVAWQAGTASVVSHVMAQRQSDGADRPGKLGVGPPLLRRDPHPGMGLAELLQLVGFTGAGYYVCPLCRRYTAAPDQHHAADHVGAAAPDATAYAPLALAELVEGLERFFLRYELLQYDMQTYGPIYVYTLETEVYDDMNRGLREARAAHSAAEPYKVVERYWPFIYRLEYALGQLPCQTGVVYRAIQHLIPMEVYPVGEFIVWQAFSSASRSEAAARFFLRGAGTVFIIHSRTAVAIPRFSSYPEEDEVLFRPYSTFYVRRHGTDSMRQFWAGDNPLTNVMVYELDEVQLSALERLADSLLQCILRFVDVPGWRQLSVVSHRVSALAMGQLLQRKAAQEALLQPPPTPPPAAADPAAAEPEAAPTVEAAAAAAELPQDKAALAARVAELETEVKQVKEELYSGLRPAVLQLQTINPMQIRELRTMAKPPPAVETIMLVLCEWLDEPRAVVFNVRPGFKHDWSSVMRMTSDPKFLQRLLKFDPDSLTGQRVAWTSGVLIEQTPPTVSMVAHRFRQWVDAHCRYHYNREVNQPKKERLKHLESQLQAAQQRLTELTAAPEPEPPPPPPEPSTTEVVTLDLEVKEGRDLVALDMFGERDPYVQLCWGMDSEPFYTTKVQRGTQPVWLEGVKGVQIPDGTRFISISVWDKNILKEEFMGMHQLPLEPPPDGDLWLKLRARENEPKDAKLVKKGDLGEIHINVKCHGAQRGSGEDMPTGDTPVAADPLALSQADPQDPEPAVQAEEPPRMQSLVTDHALDAEPPAEDFGAGVTVPVPPDPPPVSVPGTEDTVAPEGPVGKGLQSKAPKGKLELPDSEHTTDKTATPKSQEGKGPSKSPKGKLDRPPASPREGEHTMTPKAQKQGKGSTKAPKGKLDLPPEAPHQGEAEDAPTPKSQGSNPDRLSVDPKSRSASVEPTSAEATSTSGKPAKKSKASKKAMTTDKDASLASLGEVSFQEASHSQDPSSRKPSSVAPEEAEPVQMPAPKGKKNVGKKI